MRYWENRLKDFERAEKELVKDLNKWEKKWKKEFKELEELK